MSLLLVNLTFKFNTPSQLYGVYPPTVLWMVLVVKVKTSPGGLNANYPSYSDIFETPSSAFHSFFAIGKINNLKVMFMKRFLLQSHNTRYRMMKLRFRFRGRKSEVQYLSGNSTSMVKNGIYLLVRNNMDATNPEFNTYCDAWCRLYYTDA